MKILIALALVCGCAADLTTDVREQSGTRLKVEWWELAGGGLQIRGVYDTQAGAEARCIRQSDTTFACGDVPAAFAIEAGASRVVPTSLRSDDGLVLPVGFYDTERGVECVPMATTAGDWRCAPYDHDVTATDPLLAIEASGGDRLAPRFMTSADGLRQHMPSFFDRELAATCSVAEASASAYCLPSPTPTLPLDAYVPAFPSVDP